MPDYRVKAIGLSGILAIAIAIFLIDYTKNLMGNSVRK
jgi:hypothetical protein